MPDAIETHRNSLSHNISLKMCLRLIPSFIFPGIVLITPTRRRLLSLAFSADCIRVCSWVFSFFPPRRNLSSLGNPQTNIFNFAAHLFCISGSSSISMCWIDSVNVLNRLKKCEEKKKKHVVGTRCAMRQQFSLKNFAVLLIFPIPPALGSFAFPWNFSRLGFLFWLLVGLLLWNWVDCRAPPSWLNPLAQPLEDIKVDFALPRYTCKKQCHYHRNQTGAFRGKWVSLFANGKFETESVGEKLSLADIEGGRDFFESFFKVTKTSDKKNFLDMFPLWEWFKNLALENFWKASLEIVDKMN